MNLKISDHPLFAELGFKQNWINAGVLSDESFALIISTYDMGEDQSPEHYRWKAFKHFLRSNSEITESAFREIYDLSLQDPDYAMGRAMRFDLLKHKGCPVSIIDEAIADTDVSLRKHALKIKSALERSKDN